MDLSELDRKIVEGEEIEKKLRQKFEEFRLMEMYNGPDKIVSFEQYKVNMSDKFRSEREIIKSHIPTLDNLTTGFIPGQLVVVSGPTGEGKTSLLQSFTSAFAGDGVNCLWFSHEESPWELGQRFGDTVPNFYLPSVNVDYNLKWLKERIIEGVAKRNTKVVFIDHLHYLISLKDLEKTNTSLLIGGIMRELKVFAGYANVVIFLISHLKMTDVEHAPNKDDLRDSSFVAQESDHVLMLWRGREKDRSNAYGFKYTGNSILSLVKNRWNGKLGMVKMSYNNGRFTELTQSYGEQS